MENNKIAVLLLAFGGPTSMDEIEPFLKNVTSGRISQEKIQEVIERYKKIGGKSPLLDITKNQADALEKILNKEEDNFEVFVGMRHWHPFISETLKTIFSKNIKNIIALPLNPYYSSISIGAYQIALERELHQHQINEKIRYAFIKSWHNHPLFIRALSELIVEGRYSFSSENFKDLQIIFTAHSIPKVYIDKGEPYLCQIKETIEGVTKILWGINWHLAFQSKSAGPIPWLEPDVIDVFKKIKDTGGKDVLIAPIGFVSDNIEILYDIDIFYKNEAEKIGLNLKRTPCLNTKPLFIESLAQITKDTVSQL